MKTVILFCFLLTGNLLSAQFGVSLFGNLATPGQLLYKSSYPSLGAGGGMGLLYRMNAGVFSIDAGVDGQDLIMGRKVYRFGDERDAFYNSTLSGNIYLRLIYNEYKWRPYAEAFYGYLQNQITEEYYYAGTMQPDRAQNTLYNNSFSSSGFSFGVLYAIDPDVDFQVGVNYTRSAGGLSYFDFSTASADAKYVNYQIGTAENYDVWSLKLGFIFFLNDSDATTSSSNSSGSSGSPYFPSVSFPKQTPSSHRKINGHGQHFNVK